MPTPRSGWCGETGYQNEAHLYKTTLTSSFSEHLERKNVGPTIPKPVLLQNEKAFAQGCLPEELFDNNLRLSHTFAVEEYALRTEIAVNHSGRILPASREWIHPWATCRRRPDDRSAMPRCGTPRGSFYPVQPSLRLRLHGRAARKAIQRILFWDL